MAASRVIVLVDPQADSNGRELQGGCPGVAARAPTAPTPSQAVMVSARGIVARGLPKIAPRAGIVGIAAVLGGSRAGRPDHRELACMALLCRARGESIVR